MPWICTDSLIVLRKEPEPETGVNPSTLMLVPLLNCNWMMSAPAVILAWLIAQANEPIVLSVPQKFSVTVKVAAVAGRIKAAGIPATSRQHLRNLLF